MLICTHGRNLRVVPWLLANRRRTNTQKIRITGTARAVEFEEIVVCRVVIGRAPQRSQTLFYPLDIAL